MLLQNQEAAERRRTFIISSLVGGLELGEVRGSQETNTTPFNFIQLPQKVGGAVGVWGVVFPTAEQEEEKSTQRGGRV